jgi:hypothetical protein
MKRFTLQTLPGRGLGTGAAAVIIAFEIIGVTRERWAVTIPDDVHTYGIRFRGSIDLFFTPRLGWFLDHALWMFFALGLAAIAADWLARPNRIADASESA